MHFRAIPPVWVLPLFLLLLLCTTLSAYEQEGLASWYGGKFQGRQTANGEIFDTNKFTAAHKTLAFGTVVKVTNLENGKSTVVRINDRGPFIPGRIIDLSRAAAVAIGLAGKGVAKVRVEELPSGSPEAADIAATVTLVTYSIQVAAFRSREYAERSLERLRDKGFTGTLERTTEGIYRILVKDVQESELEDTKQQLQEHGWGNVVARRESQL
ncbi:Endolytic peptidoglycan transglycosylase RlpA [subsurface metagenome]